MPSPATSGTAPAAEAGEIDVAALQAVLAGGGATVVDVRSEGEYTQGHIPGARHIPLDLLQTRATELDPAQPVYLVCASGGRSARATRLLAQAGFAQPINVLGGTNAWREAGYPLD